MRDLPIGVYRNGSNGYMGVVRHLGVRHYLGTFETEAGAAERVAMFRAENPVSNNRSKRRWQPGDEV